MHKKISIVILICIFFFEGHLQAQQSSPKNNRPNPKDEVLERDLVNYPATFFDRYQPITALDMVNQIPGFQLDSEIDNARGGPDVRGFSEAAGNVLIDDRRPSAKQDNMSSILARIPAGSVARIELIRGQVRSIDLRGNSSVVNLILRVGIPATVQWEGAITQTFGHGSLVPDVSISLSDSWKGIDFNIGIKGRKIAAGRTGTEDVFDNSDTRIESRFNDRDDRNKFYTGNLNASSWWGDTFIQFNSNYNYGKRHIITDSRRLDELTNNKRNIFFDDIETKPTYEFGLDFERSLSPDFLAKGIMLYVRSNKDFSDTQLNTDSNDNQILFRKATGEADSTELIVRSELDWTAFSHHLIQANVERAYNVLNGTLVQTDDIGAGPVLIDVPGANSRVEEIRWDFLLKDTWLLGQFELGYGIGAEASTITQTGDVELTRDFFFLKPQVVMSYSSANSDQTRLRLAREIAQLDLDDFVSATEFLDNDIALGNPNIKPDATWKLELSQEKRFRGDAVIKLTVYHNWISDVLDFLPLTPTFEAPGNIGDGRRWGLLWESTVPLDGLGLAAAKLDIKFRWQDSIVIDPVTGENRVLSFSGFYAGPVLFNVESKYGVEIDYRQDFQAQQVSWGWHIGERSNQLRFKVNELEIYNDGVDLQTFIETARWLGIKTRLSGENLLDFTDSRERRIYAGERDLSPLAARQIWNRTRGARLLLSFSGNF